MVTTADISRDIGNRNIKVVDIHFYTSVSCPVMNGSLKGYTPALGRLLGLNPMTLYERQRALVRHGLLDAEAGRGPGSGVRTTASSVARLLVSALATDRLSEAYSRTRVIADARPAEVDRCPYTGARSFWEGLTRLLSMSGVAAGVIEVTVSRTADRAAIKYWHDVEPKVSWFLGPAANESGFAVAATMSGQLLQQIAQDVQSISLETFEVIL
jgi:hypothetical protein